MKNSFFVLLLFACACTGKKTADEINLKQGVKFEQYLVEGQLLYQQHCSNCHQTNGLGLGRLYPPLAKSDFLMSNLEAVICLMKNGISGVLVVNGIEYNQAMPGVISLTNLEIAEIATYVYNSWGNEKGPIATDKVEMILKGCGE
jgi:cytochrome c551